MSGHREKKQELGVMVEKWHELLSVAYVGLGYHHPGSELIEQEDQVQQ